tara:strand:+ start:30 stop:713 length:684 start_codon:yes stop_codon:yes gene_type:complete
MHDLTLIIPAKQEVEALPTFLKEIENFNCKKFIILQKEDLETKKAIKKNKGIKIIEQKNNGYGNALIEGINSVKTKYCCIINADGSMNPSYLYKMRKLCQNKDFIFASRYQKPGGGSDDDDFITSVGNYFFTFAGNILFNLKISDILYTYILGKTSSFKKLKLKNFDFRICIEMPIKAKIKNMSYSCLPSYERKRIGGKKKVSPLKDGLLILTEIVRYFFKKKNNKN